MRQICLCLFGLLIVFVWGCGGKSPKMPQEATDAKTSKTSGENAGDGEWKVPEEFPGMKGITDARAKVKAKIARLNLRQIGLGSLNYLEVNKTYPFHAGSHNMAPEEIGKLSWRVWILPYIEQGELFDQFKRNEPWDSEHNKKLLEKMPEVFKMSDEAKPGHTQYVGPFGKGSIAEGEKASHLHDIEDGTANTLMVVTVKPEHAEPWTKPGGVEIDPDQLAEILGGDPNGFLALFADGSTKTLDPEMNPETVEALLTVKGKEAIDKTKLPPDDFPR